MSPELFEMIRRIARVEARKMLKRYVTDDMVEEIEQMAAVECWKRGATTPSYIATIARTATVAEARRVWGRYPKKRGFIMRMMHLDASPEPGALIGGEEDPEPQDIGQILKPLSRTQRTFALLKADGYTQSEIARMFGCTDANVAIAFRGARANLRRRGIAA